MTNPINVEEIDLAHLARVLLDAVGAPVMGYVVGRTIMRDAVGELLSCSLLEAENLVETMISRGWIVRVNRAESSSDIDAVEWVIKVDTP